MIEIVFLGTGTSQGVPIIGSNHPVCKSNNPKDKKIGKDGYSTQNKFTAELLRRQANTGKDFSGNSLYKKKETKKEHYDWRSTLDEKCWAGYEKKGMKTMFGKRYPNCVKKSKKKK